MTGLPPPISPLATLSPPGNPAAGQIWPSYSLKHVRPPKGSGKRSVVRLNAQEQTVWIYGGYWWNMHTDGSAALFLMQAPVGADITQSAVFTGSISGSTLTVSQPTNTQSVDLGSMIQAGMTVHSGTGAVILPFGTSGTTGRGGVGTYALGASPGTVAKPTRMEASYWSVPVACIGNGAAGVPTTCAHAYVYVEGSTLYCYFVATTTSGAYTAQNTYVATASIGAPYTWTPQTTAVLGPQGNGSNGNVSVYKSGSTYYMFQEALSTGPAPLQGSLTAWQIYVATCSTPTGVFAVQAGPLKTLQPTANGGASHLRVYERDAAGNFIALYHANPDGQTFPSFGYRAMTQNLASDAWVPLDNRKPFVRPNHPLEVDQIADVDFCRSPTGAPYLFWTAMDNIAANNTYPASVSGSGYALMCAPMGPTPLQYDGWNWVSAVSEADEDDLRPHFAPIYPVNHLLPSSFYGGWAPAVVTGGAAGVLQSGGNQNEYVTFDVCDLTAGTYALDLLLATGPANGIISMALDGGEHAYHTNLAVARNPLLQCATLVGDTWVNYNVTSAPAAGVIGADGASGSAFILTATSTGACRTTSYFTTVQNTGDYVTLVCYLKSGTAGAYLLAQQSGTNIAYVAINANGYVWSSGAVSYSVGAADGNGWQRVIMTVQTINTSAFILIAGVQNNSNSSGLGTLSAGFPNCGTSGLTAYVHKPKIVYGPADDGFDVPTWESLSSFDTYSASAVANVKRTLVFDMFAAETMRRNLKLTMAAKNASSTGYQCQLMGLSIRRLTA